MRDSDIRRALHARLTRQHEGENVLVVDELRMCWGEARIDVAVFNARLSGYEIKSERDTLSRLSGQMGTYSAVCDQVTLVVSEKHAANVRACLPDWCGILVATMADGELVFAEASPPRQNPLVDAHKRAQLLWRSEAIAILSACGAAQGCLSKPRYVLWKELATRLAPDDLNAEIVAAIKARGDWRSDRRRAQCDATPLR